MMLTRRSFFSATGLAALGVTAFALPGCGGSRGSAQSSSASSSSAAGSSSSASAASSTSSASASASAAASKASSSSSGTASGAASSNALVVYFSHTGENYGVGNITEGNTAIIAKMIAEKTGAELFEVVPTAAYPEGYDACCDVARDEQSKKARPSIANDIDIASYSTVYLGYPIWWGDLPMCLYTFLEAHDWSGKDIRPFCTHAGSGLGSTPSSIQSTCSGATVGQGLAVTGVTAQNSRDEARSSVEAWLG